MKIKILLALILCLNTTANISCQIYTQKKKKILFNELAYNQKLDSINKAKKFSELPIKIELVSTQDSYKYKLIEEIDFVTEKKKYKWVKDGLIKRAEVLSGNLYFSERPFPLRYGTTVFPKLQRGYQKQYLNNSKITKNSVLVELNDGSFVFLNSLNKYINSKYLPKKNSTLDNIPIFGGVASSYIQKKVKEEWKKGYNLIDELINKISLIQQKKRYNLKKLRLERERFVKDSITKMKILQNRKKDSLYKVELTLQKKQDSLAEIDYHMSSLKRALLKIEREERLIKKYGKKDGNTIIEKKVQIGFTKEMCIESWGKPIDINRTTNSYGVSEQWVYNLKSYLYFKGNTLTSIQN